MRTARMALFASAISLGAMGAVAIAQTAKPRPPAGVPARGAPQAKCDAKAIRLPPNTTIETARAIAEPVPYCRLDGYMTTRDPGPNRVKFQLSLPRDWNGRYLFTVQGGAAGWVPDPTPAHLSEGYAIASTDKGVRVAHGLDFSFRSDPAMSLDWAHRGVHVSAEATQALTRAYYRRPKLLRYVMGCSGGGDGTLTEAEMYPRDFEGHIPGAMNTDWPYGTALNWGAIGQRVNRNPQSWISPAEYERIYHVLLAKYDGADGAIDGLIWDGRAIKLDRSDRQALSFLSDAQFGTLKLISDGVRAANGTMLATGHWLANPKTFPGFLTGNVRPPWKDYTVQPSGFTVTDTSSKGRMGENFSVINDVDFSNLPETVEWTDRSKFDHRKLAGLRDSGGKIIFWVGAADQAVSPEQILGYTDRADKTFGPTRSGFMRTFLVPGLFHCGNGDNAPTDTVDRMLKAAQAWVEEGRAPDQVIVSNAIPARPARAATAAAPAIPAAPASPADRTYLLCPYPQRSVFMGGVDNLQVLDVKDARNWRCQA